MTKAHAIAAFRAVCAAHADATRTVVNGVASVTGFLRSVAGQSDLGPHGQMGPRDGGVYAVADDIGTVTMGEEITVGDSVVTVTGVSVDPLGALVTISYRVTRPVVAEVI